MTHFATASAASPRHFAASRRAVEAGRRDFTSIVVLQHGELSLSQRLRFVAEAKAPHRFEINDPSRLDDQTLDDLFALARSKPGQVFFITRPGRLVERDLAQCLSIGTAEPVGIDPPFEPHVLQEIAEWSRSEPNAHAWCPIGEDRWLILGDHRSLIELHGFDPVSTTPFDADAVLFIVDSLRDLTDEEPSRFVSALTSDFVLARAGRRYGVRTIERSWKTIAAGNTIRVDHAHPKTVAENVCIVDARVQLDDRSVDVTLTVVRNAETLRIAHARASD